ncbi:MAG: GGDEF domain-containing protein [Peptostreptococcaceae bacterium]|nr:GGDEF domain-containing protein [Peptostreptococcaceae bacterium]
MDSKVLESNKLFERIEKTSPFPTVIYARGEIVHCNNLLYEEVGITQIQQILNENLNIFFEDITINHEFSINTIKGIDKRYEIKSKAVELEGSTFIVSYLIVKSEKWQNEKQLMRVTKLQNLILDVTHQVFHLEKLQDIYEIILETSFQALEKATVGTVLLIEGENLTVAAHRGFSDSIKKFVLPLTDSFLYQKTEGLLNRTIYIKDLDGREGYHPIETSIGNEKLIRSTISTPIWIEGNFFGMINIDSNELDAFDETDKNIMEFLKTNIEFALTNQLLYFEKASLAKLDSLTALYNRRSFEEFIGKAIARAERYTESFCIVMIDIDGLKRINDEHGHLMGDNAIKAIAGVISQGTRKSDMLSRIGGDEFVGIYIGINKQQLAIKYEALRQKKVILQDDNDNSEFKCTFSYGIASYPVDGNTTEELIRKADLGMYKMKERK